VLAAVLFVVDCVKGTAFVAAWSSAFVFLCYTRFAGLLVGGKFRIATPKEEAAIVFAGGYAFILNSLPLMLLAVAVKQDFGLVFTRTVSTFRKGFHFRRLYKSL
jgi:hypothetical protein